jgi:hypothetical protein
MNSPEKIRQMIPITESWLRNEAEWKGADFEKFDEDTPEEKGEFVAKDILELQLNVSFDSDGPGAPRNEDNAAFEAEQRLWDAVDQTPENPQFVRFDEHPHWDDETINQTVKQVLVERFRNKGAEWWQNNR